VANALAGAIRPVTIPAELLIEVEFRLNGAEELAALVPGAERAGGRTVRYRAADPRGALNVILVWSALASEYLGRYLGR
jgi:D-amino peptidase